MSYSTRDEMYVVDGEGTNTCPFHSCLVTQTKRKAMQRRALKLWSQGLTNSFEYIELCNSLGIGRLAREARRNGNKYSIRPML